MKTILTIAAALVLAGSLSSVAEAQKKCKKGMTWDAGAKKCVSKGKGSH